MTRLCSALTVGLTLLVVTVASAWGQAGATRVVDDDGAGTAASCDDATAAFMTIGAAIAVSVSGDTVIVCPGTYRENVDFGGHNITLRSAAGPDVTRIDGNAADSVVTFAASEGLSAVLDGFTIQNGRSDLDTPGVGDGGGIRIHGASPTIRNNTIINNRACAGIGVSVIDGSPLIEGNTISQNVPSDCGGGGGGIGIFGSSAAIIRSNTISHNTVRLYGGGIGLDAAGAPTIDRNVISDNIAMGVFPCSLGGGISMRFQSDGTVTGNLIVRNSAGCGGGVYWLVRPGAVGLRLVNNTIANNDSPQGSGIMTDWLGAQAQIINNIVVAAPGQTAVFCDALEPNPLSFTFNNVFSPSGVEYGGICADQTGLNGNISSAPSFADVAAGNFHLMPGSAGIDAGTNAALALPVLDLDGHARVLDGDGVPGAVVDMGADEISATPTLVLQVNGRRPSPPVVFTPGAAHVTLNVMPTTYSGTLDWYWAIAANGQVVWVTSGGLSLTPAPLVQSPPVVLTNVTLLNAVFPPGTALTNAFFLVNGSTVVSMDVVSAVVVE